MESLNPNAFLARCDSPELGRGQVLLAGRLVILISGLGIRCLMVRLLEQGDTPVSLQKGTLIALDTPLTDRTSPLEGSS